MRWIGRHQESGEGDGSGGQSAGAGMAAVIETEMVRRLHFLPWDGGYLFGDLQPVWGAADNKATLRTRTVQFDK
jgi:hypothetical protein